MQTFLPYPNFKKSVKCLDYRRLGKQRVEAFQILNVLLGRTKTKGWINHPATKMWCGYENALKSYFNVCVDEWKKRGFNNNMRYETIKGEIIMPPWLGGRNFHKSNLLRKLPEHYDKHFKNIPVDLPYIWPI